MIWTEANLIYFLTPIVKWRKSLYSLDMRANIPYWLRHIGLRPHKEELIRYAMKIVLNSKLFAELKEDVTYLCKILSSLY